MPRLFTAGIALFLLLGAGYGILQAARATLRRPVFRPRTGCILQAARATPWDCSDWQAFAHEDRTTAILETLAENRGKTLYCGIDQSDAFTKAETWAAGKDRNERDDTVYFGENGSFRGFIAAQEGWLTEGESGITGQSESTIFEFPKNTQRTKRVKRFTVSNDPDQFPINAVASCGQVLGIICTREYTTVQGGVAASAAETGRRFGRIAATGGRPGVGYGTGSSGRSVTWDTNLVYDCQPPPCTTNYKTHAIPTTAQWLDLAATAVARACRARGARYMAGSAQLRMGHSENSGADTAQDNHGPGLGFFLRQISVGAGAKYPTRQSRAWTGKCKKVIRRNR